MWKHGDDGLLAVDMVTMDYWAGTNFSIFADYEISGC